MHDGADHHHDHRPFSLDLNNLKAISVLGRGAKGVVFLVQTEKAELLALKAISRSSSTTHGDERRRRIYSEREILSSLHHPLLPKLQGFSMTDKIVGYAIDYCPGGDLDSLRKQQTENMFSDNVIRFYAAELVLALEYLHELGIVYRDLKPENVMIQGNGHLMLVDFDLSTKIAAKSHQSEFEITPEKYENESAPRFRRRDSAELGGDPVVKSNSFVGTEEYVAPEIILGDGHGFAVDWWCLGVTLYEMLYGATPFRGANRKETFRRILKAQPELTGQLTPLRDLIGKLLEKDAKKRIGVGKIKGHDFFKDVDWDWILELPRPPFIPEMTDVGDMTGNKGIDVEEYVQGLFNEKLKNGNCGEIMDKDKLVNNNKG